MRASRASGASGTGSPPDAFELAVRLLTQRPHGEAELARKLRRRGCPEDAMEDALARARRLGYLDDAAFARVVATRRSQTHGPAVIAAELTSKGVGRDLVREALGEVSREHLVAAARRLAGRAGGADPRRVAGRLLRRGFSSDVVREALDGDVDP